MAKNFWEGTREVDKVNSSPIVRPKMAIIKKTIDIYSKCAAW